MPTIVHVKITRYFSGVISILRPLDLEDAWRSYIAIMLTHCSFMTPENLHYTSQPFSTSSITIDLYTTYHFRNNPSYCAYALLKIGSEISINPLKMDPSVPFFRPRLGNTRAETLCTTFSIISSYTSQIIQQSNRHYISMCITDA